MDNDKNVPDQSDVNKSQDPLVSEATKAEAEKTMADNIGKAEPPKSELNLDASAEEVKAPEEPTSETAPVESASTTNVEPAPTPASTSSDFASPTVATDVKPTVVEKKKMSTVAKVFLIIGIVAGAIAIGIIALIIILAAMKVDYSTAYKSAQALRDPINDTRFDYSCTSAIEYVGSGYTTNKDYEKYIEKCKTAYAGLTSELIDDLEKTDGISRDTDVKAKFDEFKMNYNQIADLTTDLDKKLDYYIAYHNFVTATRDFSFSETTDAEVKKAAAYLVETDNKTLQEYGKGWQEKALAALAAQRNYDNRTSWYGEEYNTLNTAKNNTSKEYNTYVKENKPDMESLVPLDFSGTEKLYTSFKTLYNVISDKYSENYNFGSYDCAEFGSSVVCEKMY